VAQKKRIVKEYKQKVWTEEEILTILQVALIEIQTNDDEFYPMYFIVKQGLGKSTLHRWINDSQSISEKFNELKSYSESKIAREMIKSRSKLHPIATMFLLKCQNAWIEEEKRLKKEVENTPDTEITVGFEDENQDKS